MPPVRLPGALDGGTQPREQMQPRGICARRRLQQSRLLPQSPAGAVLHRPTGDGNRAQETGARSGRAIPHRVARRPIGTHRIYSAACLCSGRGEQRKTARPTHGWRRRDTGPTDSACSGQRGDHCSSSTIAAPQRSHPPSPPPSHPPPLLILSRHAGPLRSYATPQHVHYPASCHASRLTPTTPTGSYFTLST